MNADALENYKDLLKTATADFEAHLESIDEKLERIFDQSTTNSESNAAERRLIKEEQSGTRRCLEICKSLAEHIGQIQLRPGSSDGPSALEDSDTFPTMITNVGLQECRNSLDLTGKKLERHLQDLIDRLVTKSNAAITSSEDAADLVRLSDEWKTTPQCLEICSRADHHLKENVSVIDIYATGDAVQFMVSTNDKIVHGKNRGLGWRTRQVGGHLDNISLQQLSRHIMTINIRDPGNTAPTPPGDHASAPVNAEEHNPNSSFRERYGQGFKLPSPSDEDKAQSQRPAQTASFTKPKAS